jgi:3',5'-cyclic AMP phosphodiesterase CpdA
MRVAVLADIHGNLPALEAVLGEVDAAGADAIVLPGDMTVGPLQAETLDLLASLGERAHLGARQLRAQPGRGLRRHLPAHRRRP